MFASIAKWGIKKWSVSRVNAILTQYATNIRSALAALDEIISKVEAVLGFLRSLREKLDDDQLTEDEADAALDEVGQLVTEIFK